MMESSLKIFEILVEIYRLQDATNFCTQVYKYSTQVYKYTQVYCTKVHLVEGRGRVNLQQDDGIFWMDLQGVGWNQFLYLSTLTGGFCLKLLQVDGIYWLETVTIHLQ